MRFNRGTIVLLIISLVVIGAILLLNSNPASAPEPSATSAAVTGRLFPDLTEGAIVRFQISDNEAGTSTTMTKDNNNTWSVAETANPMDIAVNQARVSTVVTSMAMLSFTNRFMSADVSGFNLADYGLDAPAHTLTITDSAGTVYTVYVGKANPGNTHFYTQFEVAPGAESTAEPQARAEETVYLVQRSTINSLITMIAAPPYESTPTPTSTPLPTANPYSEVEQTATAAVEMTMTAEFTPEVTMEVTSEVTAEVTPEATEAP